MFLLVGLATSLLYLYDVYCIRIMHILNIVLILIQLITPYNDMQPTCPYLQLSITLYSEVKQSIQSIQSIKVVPHTDFSWHFFHLCVPNAWKKFTTLFELSKPFKGHPKVMALLSLAALLVMTVWLWRGKAWRPLVRDSLGEGWINTVVSGLPVNSSSESAQHR